MKGIEKLTSVRLAEVLSQKNAVATDAITEALYTQDQFGEPFVDVLVSSDRISEWDLAKVVVEHFQLPFMMASNYSIDIEVKDRIPKEILFKHQIVPLDVFGDAVTLVMPILTPFEVLTQIQTEHKCEVFPYVGLISENKRVLGETFEDFKDWQANEASKKEKTRKRKPSKQGNDWMNIFDDADAKVRGDAGGEEGGDDSSIGSGLSMFDDADEKVRRELS